MTVPRILVIVAALAPAACASAPPTARTVAHPTRSAVSFALDPTSSALLPEEPRAFVRAVLETLCRHDTRALMDFYRPEDRAEQLAFLHNDPLLFLADQLLLDPIQAQDRTVVSEPAPPEQGAARFAGVFDHVAHAVVVDVRTWNGDTQIVRGVLVLPGGQLWFFQLAVARIGDGYRLRVFQG